MSRIGNKVITIPQGVNVTIEGNHVTVKGPKGTLERDISSAVKVEVKDNEIKLTIDNPANGNLHGLTRTLIKENGIFSFLVYLYYRYAVINTDR